MEKVISEKKQTVLKILDYVCNKLKEKIEEEKKQSFLNLDENSEIYKTIILQAKLILNKKNKNKLDGHYKVLFNSFKKLENFSSSQKSQKITNIEKEERVVSLEIKKSQKQIFNPINDKIKEVAIGITGKKIKQNIDFDLNDFTEYDL